MKNVGCALATSADTVKASFFQSLGSRGDVQGSSSTIYTSVQQLGLKTVTRTQADRNKKAQAQQLEPRNLKTRTR